MNQQEIMYDYEQVLLGKRVGITPEIFRYSEKANEELALIILRYVVEHFLQWTPYEMQLYFNANIISLYKLKSIIKFIKFPNELDPKIDFFWYAHKLYPDKIRFDSNKLTLLIYKKVLEGTRFKFPKRFFEGRIGEKRAILCLRYAINNYCYCESTEETFRFFGTPAGNHFLKEVKLSQACKSLYETSVDFLRESLPIAEQDKYDLLYNMIKFRSYYDKHRPVVKST